MFDYDEHELLPDYAVDNPQYDGCESRKEARILRLLLTYRELASRHETPEFVRLKYTKDGKRKSVRDNAYVMRPAGWIIDRLPKDVDPSYFMSYVFEMFTAPKYIQKLTESHAGALAGILYPSWNYIAREKKRLVEEFTALPSYSPTTHQSKAHLKHKTEVALNKMAERWMAERDGRTEEQYWLDPRHICWPYLDPRYLHHVVWLRENEDKFVAKFDMTLAEFIEFMEDVERDTAPKVPMTVVANEEWMDEYHLARVAYLNHALEQGRDVTTKAFEKEMEDNINPIDSEHPDTVMYFTYGVGQPRREYCGK